MEARNPNAFNWWPVVEAAFNEFRNRHAPHIPPWTHVTSQEKASWLTIVTTVSNVVAPFGVGAQRQTASWQEQLEIVELRKIIRKGEHDLLEAKRLLRDKEQENHALGQVLKFTREQLAERPKLPVNTPVNRSGRFESIGLAAAQHKFHIELENTKRLLRDKEQENHALGQVLKFTREQLAERPKLPVNTPVNRSGRFESIGLAAAQHKFHIELENTKRLLRDKEQENHALGQVLKFTREQLAERPKLPVNTPVNRSGRFESIGFVAAQHKFHIELEDFLRKVVDDNEPVTLFFDTAEQWESLRHILESMPEMQLIPGP